MSNNLEYREISLAGNDVNILFSISCLKKYPYICLVIYVYLYIDIATHICISIAILNRAYIHFSFYFDCLRNDIPQRI